MDAGNCCRPKRPRGPDGMDELVAQFPSLNPLASITESDWKAAIDGVAKDYSYGLPQPSSSTCLVEVVRRICEARGVQIEEGARDVLIDEVLRPLALGLSTANFIERFDPCERVRASPVELVPIPFNHNDLDRFCELNSIKFKDDIQRLVDFYLNKGLDGEPLLEIFLTVIQWSPSAPNAFIPHEESSKIVCWSGVFWYEREALKFIPNIVRRVCRNMPKVERLTECTMKRSLSSLSKILWDPSPFNMTGRWDQKKNQHPGLLLCKEGMINLMTGFVEKHAGGYFVCQPDFGELPSYQPDLSTRYMDERASEFFDGDEGKIYAFRWLVGASVFGNPNLSKKLLWFVGPADTAKSFLQKCLRAGLPFYITVGSTSLIRGTSSGSTSGHSGNMSNLSGKRIVLFDEVDSMKQESLLKSFMSNGEFTLRNPHEKQGPPIVLSCVPFLFGNSEPKLKEDALLSKVAVIRMSKTYCTSHEEGDYLKRPDVMAYLDSPQGRNEAFNWIVKCGILYAQNMFKDVSFPTTTSNTNARIVLDKVMKKYARVRVSGGFKSFEDYKDTVGQCFGVTYEEFRVMVQYVAEDLGIMCSSKKFVTEVAKLVEEIPDLFVFRDTRSARFSYVCVSTGEERRMERKTTCIINLEWNEFAQKLLASRMSKH